MQHADDLSASRACRDAVDDSTIRYVIEAGYLGRYAQVTLYLANGDEITGLMQVEAHRRLTKKTGDLTPPPMVSGRLLRQPPYPPPDQK